MKVIFMCVWDVIIYTCIKNVCQIYLSSFQENIKIHCFILNVKLKINSLLKICEVNISKKICFPNLPPQKKEKKKHIKIKMTNVHYAVVNSTSCIKK